MITNPNTIGLFDPQIGQIAEMLHARGALLYLDGANMNAILGQVRPGDMGVDLMHYNPHKTFSGPHGGGGPGAGPIAVRAHLAPYLPSPMVSSTTDGTYALDHDRPKSIGRVRAYFGNVGVLFRAYCYIRSQGPDGLKAVSDHAVLNANYLMSLVRHVYPVPYGDRCMHEFVASARSLARDRGVRAMDIGKRLIDYNYHAPTVYFPLVVPEALMVEPTETESRDTLEAFAEVLLKIATEDPELLRNAPESTPISRPDEVLAAKSPVLKWTPDRGAPARSAGAAAGRVGAGQLHLIAPDGFVLAGARAVGLPEAPRVDRRRGLLQDLRPGGRRLGPLVRGRAGRDPRPGRAQRRRARRRRCGPWPASSTRPRGALDRRA